MDVGLNVAVTPVGWPDAVKAIAELKPPETAVVMVEVPLLPCATETDVGEAVSVKALTGAEVTVRETVAVCVMLSPVPETVMV
jgi:cystathionine beta-lyase/cystathionine gamma-synthase